MTERAVSNVWILHGPLVASLPLAPLQHHASDVDGNGFATDLWFITVNRGIITNRLHINANLTSFNYKLIQAWLNFTALISLFYHRLDVRKLVWRCKLTASGLGPSPHLTINPFNNGKEIKSWWHTFTIIYCRATVSNPCSYCNRGLRE